MANIDARPRLQVGAKAVHAAIPQLRLKLATQETGKSDHACALELVFFVSSLKWKAVFVKFHQNPLKTQIEYQKTLFGYRPLEKIQKSGQLIECQAFEVVFFERSTKNAKYFPRINRAGLD
jgi:hypothetical protein